MGKPLEEIMDPRILRAIGILSDLQKSLDKAMRDSIFDDYEEVRKDIGAIVEKAHEAYKALEG